MPRSPRRHRLLVLPTVLIALAMYGLGAPPASADPTSIPPPNVSDWQLNRDASLDGAGGLHLNKFGTVDDTFSEGSAFVTSPIAATKLTASFDLTMSGGTGADGLTFAMLDSKPASNPAGAESLGKAGGGLGWTGLQGVAVSFDTFQNQCDNSANFVAILTTTDCAADDGLTTDPDNENDLTSPDLRDGPHTATVRAIFAGDNSHITVDLSGAGAANPVIDRTVALPPSVYVGFTGATGSNTDDHVITNFSGSYSLADLSLTDGLTPPSSPVAGTDVTFGVKVTNVGDTDAPLGYTFTAPLPSGTSVVSSPPSGCVQVDDSMISCDRTTQTIAVGANDSFNLKLHLDSGFTDPIDMGDLKIDGTIDPAGTDASSDNDSASTTVGVHSEADLTFSKSATPTQTCPNPSTLCAYANNDTNQNKIVYALTVTNAGPSNAHGVELSDTDILSNTKLRDATVCKVGESCSDPAFTNPIHVGTVPALDGVAYEITAHAKDKTSLRSGLLPTHNSADMTTTTPPYTQASNNSTKTADTDIATVPDNVTLNTLSQSTQALFAVWTPQGDGGTPITSYKLKACQTPSGSCVTTTVSPPFNQVNSQVFADATGLTNGVTYSVTVTAVNAVGESDPSNAKNETPNPSTDTSVIRNDLTGFVDTNFTGGALGCASDPSSVNCGNWVGTYNLTTNDNTNKGRLISLTAIADSQVPADLKVPCPEVNFKTATVVNDGECIGAAAFNPTTGKKTVGDPGGKESIANFPTDQCDPNIIPNACVLNRAHLEKLQQDATITTYLLGAPCLQLVTNADGTDKLTSGGQPICANPNFPINKSTGTNLCPDGTGWTAAKPCAYIYYYVMRIPGYSLVNVSKSLFDKTTGLARPVKCNTAGCDAGQIVGSSVQQGIKLLVSRKATQIVPTWCTQSKGTFKSLPCVFKVLWLNNATSTGNNDIQWQLEQAGDPGGKSSG